MPKPPQHPLDEIGPVLARWLAPYVAAELDLDRRQPVPHDLSPDYDDATCRAFLSGVGDVVLPRAWRFFVELSHHAANDRTPLGSLELAKILELDSPRNIASVLTTPLKRRAKSLGLPVPWLEDASDDNRTIWLDRDGIAGRMVTAIHDEEDRRLPHPADEAGGPHPVEHRRRLATTNVVYAE